MNPLNMSERIKRGSQSHNEAETFSCRKNRPLISTKMETRKRGCLKENIIISVFEKKIIRI